MATPSSLRRPTSLGATLARTLSAIEGFRDPLLKEVLRVILDPTIRKQRRQIVR